MRKTLLYLFLFSFTLVCSAQSETPTWTWTFYDGLSISLPNDWTHLAGFYTQLILEDSTGVFLLNATKTDISLAEDEFLQSYPDFEELETSGDARLLRAAYKVEGNSEVETCYLEGPESLECIEDNFERTAPTDEFIAYLALFPTGIAVRVSFPLTEIHEDRETLFLAALETVQEPEAENILAFHGGYAGIIHYPEGWEITQWYTTMPELSKSENSVIIELRNRHQWGFRNTREELDEAGYEELAIAIVSGLDYPNMNVIDDEEVAGIRVFIYRILEENRYDIRFAFSVDGELWFRFHSSLSDISEYEAVYDMMVSLIETYHFSDFPTNDN